MLTNVLILIKNKRLIIQALIFYVSEYREILTNRIWFHKFPLHFLYPYIGYKLFFRLLCRRSRTKRRRDSKGHLPRRFRSLLTFAQTFQNNKRPNCKNNKNLRRLPLLIFCWSTTDNGFRPLKNYTFHKTALILVPCVSRVSILYKKDNMLRFT